MMPILMTPMTPWRPHGTKYSKRRLKDHCLKGLHQRMASTAGFTLVEVVVSSSILAFALAGSFQGWSQGQALVRQANQRQALLDAIAQDLQRQQGLVIRSLEKPPWACELSLSALKKKLQDHLSYDLPEGAERQWLIQGGPPALAIRYTAPHLQAPRERLLALSGGGPVCE